MSEERGWGRGLSDISVVMGRERDALRATIAALEAERDALREGFDAVTDAAIRDGCCCEGRDESEGLDPCARCVATVAREALEAKVKNDGG